MMGKSMTNKGRPVSPEHISNRETYLAVIDIIESDRSPEQIRAEVGNVFIRTGNPEVYAALLELW